MMRTDETRRTFVRRSFLSRLAAGATAAGAVLAARPSMAQSQSAIPPGWQPARHAADDWFDRIPGAHRFFFDTLSARGLGDALHFASNYFTANRTGYGLEDRDLAVVIGVRHQSGPFALSDAIWAKYGAILAERTEFTDPKTKRAPSLNVYQAAGYDQLLPSGGVTLDSLAKRGVQYAVCGITLRGTAAGIAQKTGGKAEDLYQELVASLGPTAHVVPAGIVAVNRAQERGYSFVFGG